MNTIHQYLIRIHTSTFNITCWGGKQHCKYATQSTVNDNATNSDQQQDKLWTFHVIWIEKRYPLSYCFKKKNFKLFSNKTRLYYFELDKMFFNWSISLFPTYYHDKINNKDIQFFKTFTKLLVKLYQLQWHKGGIILYNIERMISI